MALIINGEKIEDSEIQQEAERLRPEYEQVFAEMDKEKKESQLLDWSKENVIEKVLVRQEAGKSELDIPDEQVESALEAVKQQYGGDEKFAKEVNPEAVEKIKEDIKGHMRVEQMFQDVCKDLTEPSQEQARQFYDEYKDRFKTAEQIKVGHIVKHINWEADEKADHDTMLKAQEELKGGAVFEMLVAKYSDCPDNGGDLGYFARGQMVEEFEDVVFNLGVGQESDVFRTRFGYHIAKVYERKPAVAKSFEEVKKEIIGELKGRMQSEAIDNFVDQLKSSAKIEQL